MAKKKSILPSIEILIILVFFCSFVIWAVSQCNNTKLTLQAENGLLSDTLENQIDTITEIPTPASLPQIASNSPASPQAATPTPAATIPALPPSSTFSLTKLYVIEDGLNMRSGPTRDSAVIMKLGMDEEVYFMNEITDSTEQINMGDRIADEPWIKVKYYTGHIGWVYGAGVHYYKKE